MNHLIGQSIGRYHIIEHLGEGGMATVFKAFDRRLENEVAVKVIRRDALGKETANRLTLRFEREAKALAKLTHTNIVKVIDYGEYEGSHYLVMPYLPGGTLKQLMGSPMPYAEAARLLAPIARALEFAHQQGMVHRDVKPSNILLTASGDLVLTDFGIAKLLEADESVQLTGTGLGLGTPEYMAPEQWLGKACPASDQYSLGVVLYELITGRKPYSAETPAAVLLKQANDPLPSPRQYVTGLPQNVEKVILKPLARKPENRYKGINDFGAALEALTTKENNSSSPSLEPHVYGTESTGEIQADGTIDDIESAQTPTTNKVNTRTSVWIAIALVPLFLGIIFWQVFTNFSQPETGPANAIANIQLGEKTTTSTNKPTSSNIISTTASQHQTKPTRTYTVPAPTLTEEPIVLSPFPSPQVKEKVNGAPEPISLRNVSELEMVYQLESTGDPFLIDWPISQPVAISKDNHLFAIISVNNEIDFVLQVFNIPENRLIQNIESDKPIKAVAFSPDGSKIAYSNKGVIHIDDLRSPENNTSLQIGGKRTGWNGEWEASSIYVGFIDEEILVVDYAGYIAIVDVPNGKQKQAFVTQAGSIGMSASNDKKIIASAGHKGESFARLQVWDSKSNQELFYIPLGWPLNFTISPGGERLAYYENNNINIINLLNQNSLETIEVGQFGETQPYLEFSNDLSLLFGTTAGSNKVDIYNVNTLSLFTQIYVEEIIQSLDLSDDGTLFVIHTDSAVLFYSVKP